MNKYIPKEKLQEIRQLSAFDYLKNYHPDLLIKNGRTDYIHADHDSLHFSNGKWYWWSKHKGGTSAIDYLVIVEGYTFMDACHTIMKAMKISYPVITHDRPKEAKPFVLPAKDRSNDVIFHYLCDKRMIHPEIVLYFIANGQIYQDRYYKNAVFVGFDGDKPAYAFKRSTNSDMKCEHAGSNKAFSFSFTTMHSDELHVFEGAIDMLSYMTLLKMNDRSFYSHNCLSLGGAAAGIASKKEADVPIALWSYLKRTRHIKKIVLHLDNDETGIRATDQIISALRNSYECIDDHPIYHKDMNKKLQFERLNQKRKEEF